MTIFNTTNAAWQYVDTGHLTWNADSLAWFIQELDTYLVTGQDYWDITHGGTGSNSGSITGTGALTYTAAINTDLTLAVSGTGAIVFSGTFQPGIPIEAPDGSAAAPAYTNVGDDNTGMYFSAADEVSIATGGTQAVEMNSTGLDIIRSGDYLKLQSVRALSFFGTNNVFVRGGNETLTGSLNCAVGVNAGNAFTTATENVLIGANAARFMTEGARNCAYGYQALEDTTTATDNVAIGRATMRENQTGNFNTAVGAGALRDGTAMTDCTAVGYLALALCTGNDNTAVGYLCLDTLTSGIDNTGVGHQALTSVVTGGDNVAVGKSAGVSLTGSQNTCVGSLAGDNITTGSTNIIIGYNVNADSATGSNQLNIGDVIKADMANGHIALLNEVIVGAPTGSYKGTGTINTQGDIYKNDSAYTNPDYVFEHFFNKGKIVRYANNPGAREYQGLMPLEELRAYVKANYHFPLIDRNPSGSFGRQDMLLQVVEEVFLYVGQLHDRIAALEKGYA